MLILTQDAPAAGYEITETLGLVRGNAIRSRHLGNDILASLRLLVGGELPEYTKMLAEARQQALDRMIREAQGLSATGIVGVRFASSSIAQGAAEILVYGTAVCMNRVPG